MDGPDAAFERVPAVEGYALSFPVRGIRMRVERLRRERSQLVGELRVESSRPGVSTTSDGTLHTADFNLSSDRARTERARILADRAGDPTLDWPAMLEELCHRVVQAERQGDPAVLLADVEVGTADEFIDVDPGVRLPIRHATVLFGDGGTGKSLLALHWAVRLTRQGLRVLFADWELSAEEHRRRLGQLCDDERPAIWYARCERPMTHEVDRLARLCFEHQIDYLISDSVAFASDGPPEAAETAAAYFRAVRRLRIGSLNIAHTTKGDGGDAKPFGSVFWHNAARWTLNVKRSTGTGSSRVLDLGVYHRKANLGPLAAPIGYRMEFVADRIEVGRTDLSEIVDLATQRLVRLRIAEHLKQGSRTHAELAAELGISSDTVIKTVGRHLGTLFVRVPGPDGILRVGLMSRAGQVS